MKTLAFLLLLLLQTSPPAAPVSLPTTLRQLRDHLDEHRDTFGATQELTAAKHQLRDWIESRLMGQGETIDVQSFAATLHMALDGVRLLCNDLIDECDWNFLGYVDDVRVSREGSFVVVVTAMGIWCGYDESAYVYAWQSQQWRRVWEDERNTYTRQDYLPQAIQDVQISSPDASGTRWVMTLGSQTICGGAFKDLYARAWSLDTDNRSTPVLNWVAHANDAYPRGRLLPGEVLFEYMAGGLLSGDAHSAVRHFTIDRAAAVQIDPVASLPRDFVVEWLTSPWEESRTRSESASLQARHAELQRNDGVGDFPESTLRCTAGPDLWQVATHLYERPKRYFRVRWQRPYRFTMIGISDAPYRDCTVADSLGETYPDLFGRERQGDAGR